MTFDLDDIERKATIASGLQNGAPTASVAIETREVLALVARIRELESAAREVADAPHRHEQQRRIGLLRAVLSGGGSAQQSTTERIAKAATAFVDAQGMTASRELLEHDHFAASEWEDLVLAVEGMRR